MKLLKIVNNKGFYVLNNEDKTILDISKEDILEILKQIYVNDDCEFDEMTEANTIQNEAEKIIYVNLYSKFTDFDSKKDTLKTEINTMFADVIEKYSKTKEDAGDDDFEL